VFNELNNHLGPDGIMKQELPWKEGEGAGSVKWIPFSNAQNVLLNVYFSTDLAISSRFIQFSNS
jgi:hypothetical protein